MDVTTTNNPAIGRACAAEVEDLVMYALAGNNMGIPLPTILTGPEAVSDSNRATFTFMADLPDAVLMCSIDGVNDLRQPTAQWGMCESPKTYTYLETGDHKFEVQAMAPDGTVDETRLPALWEWEVALPFDTNAPETQIVKGPPLLYANEIALFEFTGIDDQTLDIDLEFECLLDGVLLGSCDSVLSTPTVPGQPYEAEVEFMQFGKHTFEVRAMDETGNMDPTPAKYTWTYVDILAPDTEIDLGPEEETEATIATFTFLGEEENGMQVFDFECSLDGADFTYCTSPHEIEGLTVGPHVFEVRAMDLSGRVDTTPDLYEWLVMPPFDGVPPDTTIVHTPGPVSGPDAVFGFQANEIVEEFECAIDGEEWQGCESVLELEGLLSGHAHRAGARHGPRRPRRPDARELHVAGPGRARDRDHLRARADHRPDDRRVRVRVRSAQRDVLLLAQRLAVRRLHLAVAGRRPPLRRGQRRSRSTPPTSGATSTARR